jgi:purine-nucleoside phosphorylase
MNIQSAQDQANNYDFVKDIADYIRNQVHIEHKPDVVIVCGSGLGQLADEVTDARSIPYKDIPGFPVGNVVGHKGQLVFGKLAGACKRVCKHC